MWMLLIVLAAAVIALIPSWTERRARLAVVPMVLAIVLFEAVVSGLLI